MQLAEFTRWTAREPAATRRAVLDLGSNSFHLLVADLIPGAAPLPLADLKCSIRLGEGSLITGRIAPDAWTRGLIAVDDLVRRARAMSAPLAIVGTSVLRETSNGPDFADAVRLRTGCEVAILTGEDEARLSWLGASVSVPGARRVAVLDLGGGSLDVAVGDARRFALACSMPLGFLRVRDRDHVVEGARATIDAIRALVPSEIVFTGGTARALLRLSGERRLSRAAARRAAIQLSELDAAARIALGVPVSRADTIPTGAMIIATLMDLLETDHATVADGGLREGVLLGHRLYAGT